MEIWLHAILYLNGERYSAIILTIAGQNIANPIATILSAAMMLRYSFDLAEEADAIENAVASVLEAGHRTGDIAKAGEKKLTCTEMGDLICAAI